MYPGLISRTFDPFLSKLIFKSRETEEVQKAALTCLEASISSAGVSEEIKTTEIFSETEEFPGG